MKNNFYIQTNKIIFSIFLSIMFTAISVQAQSSFSVTPTYTITQTIDCATWTDMHLYIDNYNSSELILDYKIVSNTMPIANALNDSGGCWSYQLCDWNFCASLPPVGTVKSPKEIPGLQKNNILSLGANPFTYTGSGTLVIDIYERGNTSNSKRVAWVVTGCQSGSICTLNVPDNNENIFLNVYPNPSSDFIYIENKAFLSGNNTVEVYNMLSEKLISVNATGTLQKIDLQKLPSGSYFIKYNNNQSSVVKKFYKI